jgi:3-hydroxybutyryl-CoA dehydrogenase
MIRTICVCGAGTMGSGIAQVAAQAGFITIQYDLSNDMLAKSRQAIEKNLEKLREKNRITGEEKTVCLSRLIFTDKPEECVADIIIEAVVEIKQVKTDLFNQLAIINSVDTIFASNTSSISVTEIAADCIRPGKLIGMHFFNPAPLMKLVEVVQTRYTEASVTETVVSLAQTMGKTAVVCKDAPGFIVNRVARPYYLEAMKLVEEGLADIDTIDPVMQAAGFKMGPFALMDLIGMDINYNVSHIVWEALDKPERLRPSIIQKEKVDKGELGRKTGSGFYAYK